MLSGTLLRRRLSQPTSLRYLSTIPDFPGRPQPATKDAYFTLIHNISNIVRRDHHLERTLDRLRLPPPTPDLVLRVLNACPSHPSPSLRFFAWARSRPPYSPSTAEFDALLRTLARHRLSAPLWSLADQMRHLRLPLTPSTFAAIIHSYTDHPDRAVQIFNRMPHFDAPQTAEVYNALLTSLCKAGNFPGAYALVRRMARKSVPPDRETFSILVNAWCAAGKFTEAQDFLSEMSSRGFNPPVRGRDLLVDGLVNAGHLETAKNLVMKMTKEGFLPDVDTFNSLLEALCSSGEIGFCIQFLHNASELGLCPDVSTYKIIIPAVSKEGRIEEAFRLLYAAVEEGHRPFPSLYAGIIKALCRAGRFEDAFSFFSDMKVKGHPPNRPVYMTLLRMCVRGGKYVEAADYLVEMIEMGLVPRPQSFDMVVDGLKHCGKHDLARTIEQIEVSMRGD